MYGLGYLGKAKWKKVEKTATKKLKQQVARIERLAIRTTGQEARLAAGKAALERRLAAKNGVAPPAGAPVVQGPPPDNSTLPAGAIGWTWNGTAWVAKWPAYVGAPDTSLQQPVQTFQPYPYGYQSGGTTGQTYDSPNVWGDLYGSSSGGTQAAPAAGGIPVDANGSPTPSGFLSKPVLIGLAAVAAFMLFKRRKK